MATQTITLQCVADSHVKYGSHSVVHNDAFTATGKHTDYTMFGFFAFGAASIPSNATIVSAVFGGTIYGRLISADRSFIVRPAVKAWNEATLHYDSETWPLSYNTPANTATLGDTGSTFLADITNVAKAWFGGGYTYSYGLALYSDSASSYKQVYSRTTADTSKRPYIQITYSLPESIPTLSANTLSIATGQSLIITTNRQSTTYTHNVTWKVGAATGTIATAATTSGTWTLSAANVTAILAQLPSSTSGTCTITCATYDGSMLIGTRTVTLTVTVPASVVPTITGVTIAGVGRFNGYDVQGISSITVSYTASGGSGSSVASKTAVINNTTYPSSPFTHALKNSGNAPIVFTVTDTRGRTSTLTNNSVYVYPYASPKITSYQVWRATETGTATTDGTYLRFSAGATCSPIGSTNSNFVTVKIDTRLSTASTWTNRLTYNSPTNAAAYTNTQLAGAPYDALLAYYVRLTLTDTRGSSSETEFFVPTQSVLINFDPDNKSVKFGGVKTDDEAPGLICAMNAAFNGSITMSKNPTIANNGLATVTVKNTSAGNEVNVNMYATTTGKSGLFAANTGGSDSGYRVTPGSSLIWRFQTSTPEGSFAIHHWGNSRRNWASVAVPALAAGATTSITVPFGYTFVNSPMTTVCHLSAGASMVYNIGTVGGGTETTTTFDLIVKKYNFGNSVCADNRYCVDSHQHMVIH